MLGPYSAHELGIEETDIDTGAVDGDRDETFDASKENRKLAKFMGWKVDGIDQYIDEKNPGKRIIKYGVDRWRPDIHLNQAMQVVKELPNPIFELGMDSRIPAPIWYCKITAWDGIQEEPIQVSTSEDTDTKAVYAAICAAVEKITKKIVNMEDLPANVADDMIF